ncbi:unnamed protein product [Rotaria socialis]|uniref:Uncharacterized protein n=1 Tax=Rotaria socialis TaxID=392032 RepID=A0A817VX07_9BILA|nr:unnamed protein product [Rotaria socialis]CAF3385492.1 unnamed protein product [Rotaria socialis]CAF3403169.1 unnamed protein product [Rotaria socialis]CAF3657197.1 unnamed protein product [Rotaria socialis]CAF4195078.1 unnamed protein product [Rotaria socialis]
MAGDDMYSSTSDQSSTASSISEYRNLFTLQGYIKMFDDEKDGSTLLRHLKSSYGAESYKVWKTRLNASGNFESVKCLFDLFEIQPKNRSELVQLIEVFDLFENVYRNVILRPYIPAYRSINVNCGRFQSFVLPLQNYILFEKLKFQRNSSHLLIYVGTNQIETLACAHACAYLGTLLKVDLAKHD